MFTTIYLLPPEYNRTRADEERAKAAASVSPGDRRGHLEMAAMFDWRAAAWDEEPNAL
jgi:hypothetical protein